MMSITRRVLLAAGAAVALAIPARAQSDPAAWRLALQGYDPVAYFLDGRPTRGSTAYAILWDDARWHFASLRNLELFRADPDRYAPQFGASCAMRMSLGERVEPDPNNWLIQDGRLFVFASSRGPATFAADASRKAMADENWTRLRDAPIRR